ncbi:thiaminase II [Tamlana sp. 62-3]|uniref:Aminopyrimidine aminohydrolase n=1 Tax=Neotamlana sargassicola TaxID=2883125 RepID=A0A9X1I7I0_9FLAO|nr:thiaminase II [Tamlana sargassicola]MCB4808753.1 thiaminase II [Tamlana sargassicola]
MKNWYSDINNKTENILSSIKTHPFITELINGTLPNDVFVFYINQDALYLSEYKKILAAVGTKCSDDDDTQFFLDSATGIIHVENALHQQFLKNEKIINETSPSCELYISYLSRLTHTCSLEEALAAVLPCFTIYKQIGDYILSKQNANNNNPYKDWIKTYSGEDFEKSVKNAIAITNKHAEYASPNVLEKMNQAFTKASKLEWLFWDSAYNQEKWKI